MTKSLSVDSALLMFFMKQQKQKKQRRKQRKKQRGRGFLLQSNMKHEAKGTGVSASKLQKVLKRDRRINGAHSLAGMVVEMQNHKNIRIFKKSADIRKDLSA